MGGPRFSYRADKYRVFVHALFGGNRISGGASVQDIDVNASSTGFGMAFGGGLDFQANDSISIRPVQLDLLRARPMDHRRENLIACQRHYLIGVLALGGTFSAGAAGL